MIVMYNALKDQDGGGQARQKTSSAIRVVHKPSGAVGMASDAREQHLNKRNAFLRMLDTKEFKTWQKIEIARVDGLPTVEELVKEQMNPKNIKIEVKDEEDNWILESTIKK